MDIADHLKLHDSVIRAWVYKHAYGDFRKDAAQNIRLAMIEAHEEGTYDHAKGELFTYLYPALRGIAFEGLNFEYHYGIKDELDTLQEMGELQERDKLHLDPLYDSPIDGLKTPQESTLPPEEQEAAEKLMVDLTDEDREILEASYGRSIRQTAKFLGIPYATCWRRLKAARERAAILLKMR